ncbi:MAG: hypothetical protein PHU26_08800 [Methanofollis liminatans]|nr:hypothetical protein [Methanofollis liminatans]
MHGQTLNLCSGLLHKYPGFHTCVILDKLSGQAARERYIRRAIENG